MKRSLVAVLFALAGCGDQQDAAPIDAAVDGQGCDGGCALAGEACGNSAVDLDAGARPCAVGLVCCYPCGAVDCVDQCTAPCTPGSSCQENGCPGPFP